MTLVIELTLFLMMVASLDDAIAIIKRGELTGEIKILKELDLTIKDE